MVEDCTEEVPGPGSGAAGDEDLASLPISTLIPRLARTHRSRVYAPLRELDLAPGQELLLMRLWSHGPQRQSSLVEHMATSVPTVAKMVTRLERAGFVARQKDPADARAVLVTLTPRGAEVREQVEAIWADLEERTVRSLDPQETRQLQELMARLVEDLEER